MVASLCLPSPSRGSGFEFHGIFLYAENSIFPKCKRNAYLGNIVKVKKIAIVRKAKIIEIDYNLDSYTKINKFVYVRFIQGIIW